MSDRTNDEKLRILQERLAQIKLKQDTPAPISQQRNAIIETVNPKNENPKEKRKLLNLSWTKKIVIAGSVACGISYGYLNIDFNSLTQRFSEELAPKKIEYKFNLIGNNIAIINTKSSITDEGSAKSMVDDLTLKGFKSDYIYLPENSNITDEVYKVFIGPYENEEETNQWAKNLELEFNIITL